MRSFLRSSFALTALATAAIVTAQGAPPVVSSSSPKTAVAGKTFSITLTVTFPEGLHGYQNPPSDPTLIPISVTAGDKVFTVVKVNYPKGKPEKVPGEDKPVNVYEGSIKIPVTIKAPTKLGKSVLKLTVGYQECNSQSCFAPGSINVALDLTISKKAVPATPKVSKP